MTILSIAPAGALRIAPAGALLWVLAAFGAASVFAADEPPPGFPADASGSANEDAGRRPTGRDIRPGETITKDNADDVASLVSPGVLWAVHNGMDMKIVPYERIPIPSEYQKATEKYAGQVTLDDKNAVQNWVAGKPLYRRP